MSDTLRTTASALNLRDGAGTGFPVRIQLPAGTRVVRLDASRARDTGGSGLGLAISREIVRAHGGSISVGEDSHGRCRFTVTLPLPRDAS